MVKASPVDSDGREMRMGDFITITSKHMTYPFIGFGSHTGRTTRSKFCIRSFSAINPVYIVYDNSITDTHEVHSWSREEMASEQKKQKALLVNK